MSLTGDFSLSDRARALTCTPEVRDLLVDLASRVEEATAAEAVLARAVGGQAPLAPGPRHRRPCRDRHGMHAVHGIAIPAALMFHGAVSAVLAAVCRWVLRSQWRAVTAAALALATGAAATVPTVIATQAPAPAAVSPPAVAAIPRHHHHRPAAEPLAPAPVPQPPRRRRRKHHAAVIRQHATPSPSPTVSPTGSPPTPSPVPTIPLPTPAVTIGASVADSRARQGPLELLWQAIAERP